MEARDPNILPAVGAGLRAAGRGAASVGRGAARVAGGAARGVARGVGAVGGTVAGTLSARRSRLKAGGGITRDEVARQGAMVAGVGLGLGALFLLATTSAAKKRKAASTRKPALPTQPQGRPLCPSEASTSPADLTGLKSGDFVVVTLANKPGTLRDSTWAEVLNVGSRITVELVGSQRQKIGEQSEVVPESLKADWHGFHTGQKMFLRPECIWDVLHTHTKPGTLLCGSKGMFFLGKPPLTHRFLAPGFDVLLLLGSPGGSAVETVWATVTRISTTGSVITAQISGAPKHSTIHGFVVGDHLEFARDCIFGVRPV